MNEDVRLIRSAAGQLMGELGESQRHGDIGRVVQRRRQNAIGAMNPRFAQQFAVGWVPAKDGSACRALVHAGVYILVDDDDPVARSIGVGGSPELAEEVSSQEIKAADDRVLAFPQNHRAAQFITKEPLHEHDCGAACKDQGEQFRSLQCDDSERTR